MAEQPNVVVQALRAMRDEILEECNQLRRVQLGRSPVDPQAWALTNGMAQAVMRISNRIDATPDVLPTTSALCHRCVAQAEIARLEERIASIRKLHSVPSPVTPIREVEALSFLGVSLRDVFSFIADELNAGREPWKKP